MNRAAAAEIAHEQIIKQQCAARGIEIIAGKTMMRFIGGGCDI